MLAEYVNNPDHPLKFKFIYAGNQRIAMYDQSGNLHFYLNDHLGSARMVIDSTGTVKDSYKRYYAFGDAAQQTVSTGQRYRYTGKPFDDEGTFDLYYFGARYYDPKLGRFIGVDPASIKYPELSPYVYSANNPLKYKDINGGWYIHVEYEYGADDYGPPQAKFSIGWNTPGHEFMKVLPVTDFIAYADESYINNRLNTLVGFTGLSLMVDDYVFRMIQWRSLSKISAIGSLLITEWNLLEFFDKWRNGKFDEKD